MERCYYCECELNEANKSLEHIIPNALYGKLKSRDILCKECNNGLSSVDVKLVDSFKLFVNLVDGKADRNPNKDVKVKVNKKDAILKPKMEFHADKILIDDRGNGAVMFETFFSKGNEESRQYFLKQIRKYLKNKYGQDYSIEEIEQNVETRHESAEIQASLGIDSNKENKEKVLDFSIIVLGYLKISLGFCAFKSKMQDVQEEVLDAFRNLDSFNIDKFIKFVRLPDNKFIDGRLCHHIYLIGDSFNSKMFCIISLFNCLSMAIILNEEYKGDDFQESYVLDVICNKEICRTINFDFEEFSEKKFDINIIRKNTNMEIDETLEFFNSLDIYLKAIRDRLNRLYAYTCLKNMDMMSKEDFVNFIQISFDKAAEKHLLVLNKYFLCALPDADFQDILYNDYKRWISYIKQFFESNEYRQHIDDIQKTSGLSKDKARELFWHNINEWIRILG